MGTVELCVGLASTSKALATRSVLRYNRTNLFMVRVLCLASLVHSRREDRNGLLWELAGPCESMTDECQSIPCLDNESALKA